MTLKTAETLAGSSSADYIENKNKKHPRLLSKFVKPSKIYKNSEAGFSL